MVKKCFTCGAGFNGSVNDLLLLFRRQYEDMGIERYFYKLSSNGDILTCRKSQFKDIFEQQIKPNFENGAEYSHIREYNPKP